MKFRELAIGQTFDFIGPDRYNSFYEPCKKISTRKYKYPTGKPKPFDFYIASVGSLDAEVFNVGREYPEPPISDAR
jgi:hypothetical protein